MTEPRPQAGPDLSSCVAVVTGGTRGIGLATARALADAGATVVLTGRDGSVASEVAKSMSPLASGRALEVTDFDAVGAMFREIAEEHGRIDALVANAGVLEDALFGMIRLDHVHRLTETNLAGTIATVQAGARVMMRRRSGAIVLLASAVGVRGASGQSVYAATKAAIASLALSAAKELGPRGIRVNAVAPGLIQTDLIASLPAELLERRVADTSLRRLGTAEDVARAIRFLVSDEAAFITGQVLGVDGGLVL